MPMQQLLTKLTKINQEISNQQSIPFLIDHMLKNLIQLYQAETGIFAICLHSFDDIRFWQYQPEGTLPVEEIPAIAHKIILDVARKQAPLIIESLPTDPLYKHFLPTSATKWQAVLCYPLHLENQQAQGIFYLTLNAIEPELLSLLNVMLTQFSSTFSFLQEKNQNALQSTSPHQSKLQAYFLGGCQLKQNDFILALPTLSVANALFSYLLLHPYKQHYRQRIVSELWPDYPQKQGRKLLSQALWAIQRHFSEVLQIERTADTLMLAQSNSIWVDALVFQTLAETSLKLGKQTLKVIENLYIAIDLYQGDLLPDIVEEWVIDQRRYLRTLYRRVLRKLIHVEKQNGQYEQALYLAQKSAKSDPLNEPVQRELIRLYIMLGQSARAIQHFEAYRHKLRTHIGIEPDPETVAIIKQIKHRRIQNTVAYIPPSVTDTSSFANRQLPLIGREQERHLILDHLRTICHQSYAYSPKIIVDGLEGVGKTRLMQEIELDADWLGATILWGQAGTTFLYPIISALVSELTPLRAKQIKSLLPEAQITLLCAVFQELRPFFPGAYTRQITPSENMGHQIAISLSYFLKAWSSISPLVLILEDVHEFDLDTLHIIHDWFVSLLDKGALLVIITCHQEALKHSHDLWFLWQKILVHAHVKLRLSPLSLTETTTFVEQLLQRPISSSFLHTIHTETYGIPLFIVNLLQLLVEQQLLVISHNNQWSIDEEQLRQTLPSLTLMTIEKTVKHRLNFLAVDIRAFMQTISVLGFRFSHQELLLLVEMLGHDWLSHLKTIIQQGFLIEAENRYHFTTKGVQQIIYKTVAPSERTRLHLLIAAALEKQATFNQPEVIAYHFFQAEQWNKAIAYERQAAELAFQQGAYRTCLEKYQRIYALEAKGVFSPTIEQQFEVLVQICQLYHMLGQMKGQAQRIETLMSLANTSANRDHMIQALLVKAVFHILNNQHNMAIDPLQRVLVSTTRKVNQAIALQRLGQVKRFLGSLTEAESHLLKAVSLWQTIPDYLVEKVQTYRQLFVVQRDARHYERASQTNDLLKDLAQTSNSLFALANFYRNLTAVHHIHGHLQDALSSAKQAADCFQKLSLYDEAANSQLNQAIIYAEQQQYEQAITCFEDALKRLKTLTYKKPYLHAICQFAELQFRLGLAPQILPMVQDAFKLANQVDLITYQASLITWQVKVHYEYESMSQADMLVKQAQQLLQEPSTLPPAAQYELYLSVGLHAMHQQAWRKAYEAISQAYSCANHQTVAQYCASFLARCALQLGKINEANELLDVAVDVADGKLVPEIFLENYYNAWFVMQALANETMAHTYLEQGHRLLENITQKITNEEGLVAFGQRPLHQKIHQLFTQTHQTNTVGEQITFSIPHLNAPRRGPLTEDQYVVMTWTVHHPDDDQYTSDKEIRHHRLLRLLREAKQQQGIPTLDNLSEALNVSKITIRRDIVALRKQGHLIETRGSRSL